MASARLSFLGFLRQQIREELTVSGRVERNRSRNRVVRRLCTTIGNDPTVLPKVLNDVLSEKRSNGLAGVDYEICV